MTDTDTNITVQKRRIRTLEILMRHFPKAFMKTDKKPLKKGLHLDVLQHIINTTDEDLKTLSKRDIRLSLYSYTNSIAYLKTHTAGTPRIDLNGNPVGEVTKEEASYATQTIKMLLKKFSHAATKSKNKACPEIVT